MIRTDGSTAAQPAYSPIRSRVYRLVTSRAALLLNPLGVTDRAHCSEQPLRLAQLAPVALRVAEDVCERCPLDVHLGREDARLGGLDHVGSVAEVRLDP